MAIKPRVLLVDDEPDTIAGLVDLLRKRGIGAQPTHPQDLDDSQLGAADLILIDYKLKYWPERDVPGPVSLKPVNGLALAGLLRQRVEEVDEHPNRPTSIALLTGELPEVMKPLPATSRIHIAARLNGLEWVFGKEDDRLADRIAALVRATVRLNKNPLESLWELLGIQKIDPKPFREECERDVYRCLPPVHEIYKMQEGIAILRWFTHRILPYPTFLIDDIHVSSRLFVQPTWFRYALRTHKKFGDELARYQYQGTLANFDSRRWWSLGIERFLWKISGGNSGDRQAVHQGIMREFPNMRVSKLCPVKPVVCYDKGLTAVSHLIDADRAVRILPDDWPGYAIQPWATIRLAKQDESIRMLVVNQDRPRLRKGRR